MKDATGELSLTVVVIIAVIAIVTILNFFLIPSMKNYIGNSWKKMDNSTEEATKTGIPGFEGGGGGAPTGGEGGE